MKRRAFTLIELAISIAILSTALITSALIFANAIRQPRQLQHKVISASDSHSKMEQKMNEIKRDSNSSFLNASETGTTLQFGTSQSRIKGSFVSYNGGVVRTGNNVEASDKLITFVGVGYKEPEVPKILNLFFTDARFIPMPIGSEKKSLNVECFSENFPILKFIRLRFLRSNLDSGDKRGIHSHYSDNAPALSEVTNLTPSEFGYVDNVIDSNNVHCTGELILPPYSGATKQEYLDKIDRDYAIEAMTLNTTGYSSHPFTSFDDDLSKSSAKNRCIHVIGLPYQQDNPVFFDYNLALAQSSQADEKGRYYSLYDVTKAGKTHFNDIISLNGDKYEFDWGKNDVRNFIGLSTAEIDTDKFEIKEGYIDKKSFHLDVETSMMIDFPNVKKIYGNTVYYEADDEALFEFKVNSGKSYTLFAKFNLRQFEESKDNAPVSLLSYNLNSDGTLIDSSTGGFSVYVKKDGTLHLNEIIGTSNTNVALGSVSNPINLSNTKLYSDGNFKFESLSKFDTKYSRENFNIIAITIKPLGNRINIKIDLLQKKERMVGTVHKLGTEMLGVYSGDIGIRPKNDIKYFFLSDINAVNSTELESSTSNMTIELSDLLLYSTNLEAKSFGSSNYKNLTMDYLYRKYLTERERHHGGFDEYFMNKY